MGVIERLQKYILVDGFHVVVDPEQSNGSWIVDKESGNKYLDCYSQFASQALGWNHPELAKYEAEIQETVLHKIANSDMYCEVYADFVEAFSSVTPDFDHYFFIDGGALGVENALKAAFDWKLRKKTGKLSHANQLDVIHLHRAFHGRTGYTMSLTNTEPLKTAGFPFFKWTRVPSPHTVVLPGSNGWDEYVPQQLEEETLKRIEAALVHKDGNVAAIIMEPIQGEGGDNHFRKSFFEGVRKLADEHDAMLIFDEVQTGLGMTGKMWCYEHFGVAPDMMCFGKKTQVCGFCATDRIDEVPDNVFQTSGRINSTWGGNVVDMARARRIIEIVRDQNLADNADVVGTHLRDELRKVSLSEGRIKNVRGKGLFIAFDCNSPESRDELFGKLDGILVLKSGEKSIRLRPHLTMTKDDADEAVKFIKKAL